MHIQQLFSDARLLTLLLLFCIALPLHATPPPVIMVVGDSLSAAYGIEEQRGWVALLQQQLKQQGYPYKVVNTSISGDTTHGGLTRLPSALSHHNPQLVILALGANDGLRGNSLKQMQQNLTTMVELIKQQQGQILLVGMVLPPNYGNLYNQRFQQTFRRIAEQQNISLMPFLLEPIAKQRRYFQADDLHPTAAAQPLILKSLWPYLKPLL